MAITVTSSRTNDASEVSNRESGPRYVECGLDSREGSHSYWTSSFLLHCVSRFMQKTRIVCGASSVLAFKPIDDKFLFKFDQ